MNKKLFKGALVLFASILMAVSCSSGDKTGSTGNDDTTTQKKDIAITIPAPETAVATTTAVIQGKIADGTPGADASITLTGADAEDTKVSVAVTAIENNVSSDPSNPTVSGGAWKTVATADTLGASDFTVSKDKSALKINFANATSAVKVIGSGKALTEDKDYGLVKLTLTFSYKNDEKKSITRDVWVILKASNN